VSGFRDRRGLAVKRLGCDFHACGAGGVRLPLARIGWVDGSWCQQLARGRQQVPPTGTWGPGGVTGIAA
jgi:hypothetical protein